MWLKAPVLNAVWTNTCHEGSPNYLRATDLSCQIIISTLNVATELDVDGLVSSGINLQSQLTFLISNCYGTCARGQRTVINVAASGVQIKTLFRIMTDVVYSRAAL